MDADRSGFHIPDVEDMAEVLRAEQLNLLAEVEQQLRCVHHLMRRIEQLRGAKYRVGPELSPEDRGTVLQGLSGEIGELEKQLATQAECCHAMLSTVDNMRKCLEAWQNTHPVAPDADTQR